MRKEMSNNYVRGISFVQIYILIGAIFAFNFALSQINFVSGQAAPLGAATNPVGVSRWGGPFGKLGTAGAGNVPTGSLLYN